MFQDGVNYPDHGCTRPGTTKTETVRRSRGYGTGSTRRKDVETGPTSADALGTSRRSPRLSITSDHSRVRTGGFGNRTTGRRDPSRDSDLKREKDDPNPSPSSLDVPLLPLVVSCLEDPRDRGTVRPVLQRSFGSRVGAVSTVPDPPSVKTVDWGREQGTRDQPEPCLSGWTDRNRSRSWGGSGSRAGTPLGLPTTRVSLAVSVRRSKVSRLQGLRCPPDLDDVGSGHQDVPYVHAAHGDL